MLLHNNNYLSNKNDSQEKTQINEIKKDIPEINYKTENPTSYENKIYAKNNQIYNQNKQIKGTYNSYNTKAPLLSQIPIFNEPISNTQIRANESFILSKSGLNLNTTGTFNDPSLKDSTTLDFPTTGYTNVSQSFAIANITSSYNYKHIEYEPLAIGSTFTSQYIGGLGIQSVSTSFNVTEERVNLTTIRLTYVRSGAPTGVAYISGDSGGAPNNTILGGQTIALEDYTGANVTVSFNSPITLTKGTYHLVLNDTSTGSELNYFQYYYVKDSGSPTDNDDESNMYRVGWAGGGWTATNGDVYFSYESITLNDTDSTQLKNYINTPEEVDLQYNGTAISTFTGTNLLLEGNVASFSSNSSVTFDLEYFIIYDSDLNGNIKLSTYLEVGNATLPIWNNTFNNNQIPAGTFQINQRNLTIYNLPNDWNETAIYQNGSSYVGSSTYTNGSDTFDIHLDQNTGSFSWLIQFTSPNYIDFFTINQNSNPISAPYLVNTSDTLSITANLATSNYNGLNASIFIFDFNSILNFTYTNISVATDIITFPDWIISSTLSQIVQVSGSYQIVIQWLSADGTQVGYIGTDIEIVTQTNLIAPSTIPDTIIGQNILLNIDFQSVQNSTTLDGASVSYSTSWGEANSLTQSGSHNNYSATVSTATASEGPEILTLMVLLGGYVNHTVVYGLTLLRDTALNVYTNGTDFYYNDVVEILIVYQNESLLNITGATAEVDSNFASEQGDSSYLYFFNTTIVNAALPTFQLNVTVSKLYHITRTVILNLNLLANPTNIIFDGFSEITDDSNNGLNNSIVSKNFSGGSDDAFTLFLRFNDTLHKNVVFDATLDHNASAIATFTGNGTDQDYSNGSWIVEVNPSEGNIFQTIKFTLSKDGFNPAFYYITLNISVANFALTYQINDPQLVQFGTQHTVRINITDSYFSSSIIGVNVTADVPTAFIITSPYNNGSYYLTYIGATQAYSGDFSYLISFSKSGFIGTSIYLNYSIIAPSSPFDTEVNLNNGSIVDSEWGDSTYLNISFIDTIYGVSAPPTIILSNVSNQEVLVELVSSPNGFLMFRITPLTTGYWTLNLTLDANLPSYFNPNSNFMTINATIRTTGTAFTLIDPADPEYDRFIDVGLIWGDSELSNIRGNGTFTPSEVIYSDLNSAVWVEFINNTDGIHYFRVYGITKLSLSINITFNSMLFKSQVYEMNIVVKDLSTNEIGIQILQGLIPDTNKSKFGYTTHLVFNWTILDNGSIIHNPDLLIIYNGNLLSESDFADYGIAVFMNITDSSTHVWISFYTNSDNSLGYQIGLQTFEFMFSSFGLEAKSHTFEVYTEGYGLDVTVNYDGVLIPGLQYTITSKMFYANETSVNVVNATSLLRLQIIPQNTLIGNKVADGIDVTYIIEALMTNGSVKEFRATRATFNGESVYVIPSSITGEIVEIRSIAIEVSEGNGNQGFIHSISPDKFPKVEQRGFPFELLLVAIIITAVVITSVIFTVSRRRSRKQRKVSAVKQKLANARDRLNVISNIYTVLITSESGLPVYSIINSLYRNNPAISEIVSGLSVGIDSFLQSFQADFMQQLGEQITNQKQIKVSTIQREEFQIMILGTLSYRIFAFLREKPPQFAIDIFRNIIGDLEANLKLDDLIDEKTIRPRAEYVFRKYFPLTLLSTFVIDPNRLKYVENESKKKKGVKLSQDAILSLKRLALIRSGAMRNLKASPEDQGKEFDKLHKKGQLGEIGILHYDVAMNMLERTLNIPIEVVLEALWIGSSAELLIIIPFAEELLPTR